MAQFRSQLVLRFLVLWYVFFFLSQLQVSDLINCGVYVFTPKIFSVIQEVYLLREDKGEWYCIVIPYLCYNSINWQEFLFLVDCEIAIIVSDF